MNKYLCWRGQTVYLSYGRYMTGKSLYVQINTSSGFPYWVITVGGASKFDDLEKDEGFVDIYRHPDIHEFLTNSRIASFTGKAKIIDGKIYPVYKFKPSDMKVMDC